jgi:DNA-binding NarL/FixJ family response regulator
LVLAGVSGYVLKGSAIDNVAAAITAAHRGIVHFDETVARRLMNMVSVGSTTRPRLTARERDVLILIARGESSREIAEQLAISSRTVQAHTANLFAKLNVTSRTQAALWALREGLVGPEK